MVLSCCAITMGGDHRGALRSDSICSVTAIVADGVAEVHDKSPDFVARSAPTWCAPQLSLVWKTVRHRKCWGHCSDTNDLRKVAPPQVIICDSGHIVALQQSGWLAICCADVYSPMELSSASRALCGLVRMVLNRCGWVTAWPQKP